MRVSAVGYAGRSVEEVMALAKQSAECTHNHAEGIKGAQAVALAIYLARMGNTKDEVRTTLTERFGYDLNRSVDEVRPTYRLNLTCPGSVPEAIIAFLDSRDFEDAIRNAVSLGGDADTQAAIASAIAEAFYGGVPLRMAAAIWSRLPRSYRFVISRFHGKHPLPTDIAGIGRDEDDEGLSVSREA